MNRKIDWYFDFISPYSYFQHHHFITQHQELSIDYYPVLLGALLMRNNVRGPAEIPEKRRSTYRYCTWYAERHGIPFRFPDVHPYHPVNVLRLALAAGASRESVTRIFDYIWVKGKHPVGENLDELARSLGIENCRDAVSRQDVKDQLRRNTEHAAALGIFGVPTVVVNGNLFWGNDETEMVLEFLDNRNLFSDLAYKRLEDIPDGLAG